MLSQNMCPADRPCHTCHALSRTPGWTTCQVSGGLKLGESTFLNTLSRLAKLRASEEVSTYPNWKSPLCHAVSRTCHAVTLPGWPPGGDPALQTFGFQIALLWTEIRASYLFKLPYLNLSGASLCVCSWRPAGRPTVSSVSRCHALQTFGLQIALL